MISTNEGPQVGGYRRAVDHQKLGPAVLIASSLVLAIRTARWSPTHSDGLAHVEWDKEVEHSVRIAKIVLSHLTARCPELFQMKEVPWYVAAPKPDASFHRVSDTGCFSTLPQPGRSRLSLGFRLFQSRNRRPRACANPCW